jgi:predicted transcriptional regulator
MSIAPSIKEEAQRLIEDLPADASWEDLMYRIYVRQAVEAGLRDAAEGRMLSDEVVRRQFGLE